MGTVVQLKNQINDSYFQLRDSVEEKLILFTKNPNGTKINASKKINKNVFHSP